MNQPISLHSAVNIKKIFATQHNSQKQIIHISQKERNYIILQKVHLNKMEQQPLAEALTNSQTIITVPDPKINNNANTSLNTSLPIIDEQHQNITHVVQAQSQSCKGQQIQCQKQQILQYKTPIPSPSPSLPLQLNQLICKKNYQINNISIQNQSQQKQSIDSIAIMPKMPQNAVQQKNDKNLKDNSNHSNNKNNIMTKNNAKMCQIIVKSIQQQQILPIHTLPDIQKTKSNQHIHHQTHHTNFRNPNTNIKRNSNTNNNSLVNEIYQQQQLKLYIDCPVNQQVQQNKRLFYIKTQQQKQYPYENSNSNNNLRKTLLNCRNNVKSTLNDFNFNVNIKENQIKNTNSNKWKKIQRIINSLTKKSNNNNNNSTNKSNKNNDKNAKTTTTDNFMKCTETTATHNTNKKPLKNSKNNEQQTLFHYDDDEDSIQYIDGYTPGPNHYNPSRNTTSAIRQQTGSSSTSSTFSQAQRFSKIRPITALAQYSTPMTPSLTTSYNSKPSTACTLDTVSFGRNKSNPRSEIKKIQYCDWIRPHFYQENIGNTIENIMKKSLKNGGKLNGSSCFKSVKERFQNVMPAYNGPDYYIKPNLNNNNENNVNDNQLPLHYFLSNVPKGLQFQTNKYDQQNRTFQSYNNENRQKSNKKLIKFTKSTLKSFSISKKQKQLQMQRQSQEILSLQQQISHETPKNSLGSKRKYLNKTKDQYTSKNHKNKQNRNKNPYKNSDQLQYKPKAKFQQYRQSINNQNQNQTENNNFEQEYALLQKINQAAKNRRTQVTNMWITPSFNVKFQSKQTLFRI